MGDSLPSDRKSWEIAARHHGVSRANIGDLIKLDSASKIKDPQFYALRVLWQEKRALLSYSELNDDKSDIKAKQFLDNMPGWKEYIDDIKTNAGSPSLSSIENIGLFSLVRLHQMRIFLSPKPKDHDFGSTIEKVIFSPSPIAHRTRSQKPTAGPSGNLHTPTPVSRAQKNKESLDFAHTCDPISEMDDLLLDDTPESSKILPSPESPANPAEHLPSEDEQVVNMALILFLDAVTIYHPQIKEQGDKSPQWTIKRLQLKFKNWEARTDGFLRMAGDKEEVRAILETKPYLRARNTVAIKRQESAQMAAWIFERPNDPTPGLRKNDLLSRRLLISQDFFEIYLTIAEYNSKYIRYLHGDEKATIGEPSFLTMKQYGPWNTGLYQHMRHLGRLMLGFALQQLEIESYQEDPFTGPSTKKPR